MLKRIQMISETADISASIKKLADLSEIITQSMAEMATGIAEVNNAMKEVNTIAMDNQKNAANVMEEIGKFKV